MLEANLRREIRSQELTRITFLENPRGKGLAVGFAGQGSQYEGMGRLLYHRHPEARKIYEEAREILDFPLPEVSFQYFPTFVNYFKKERFIRPAIFVYNHACYTVLQKEGCLDPTVVTGRGDGFYNALVVTGSIAFEDGLKLVNLEAREMNKLLQEHPQGSFVASVKVDDSTDLETLREDLAKVGFYVKSRDSKSTLVIGGFAEHVEDCVEYLDRKGIEILREFQERSIAHTPLMKPVVEPIEEFLEGVEVDDPRIDIIALNGKRIKKAFGLKPAIKSGLTELIDWDSIITEFEESNINRIWEIAAKSTLPDMTEGWEALPAAVEPGLVLAFTLKRDRRVA